VPFHKDRIMIRQKGGHRQASIKYLKKINR
jgi:hypothetical protein